MRIENPPPKESQRFITLPLIMALTMISTLALHIFTPATPGISNDFSASNQSSQLIITFYLLGLTVGQFFYGPYSERVGRRPALFIGLSLYAIGTLCAIFSTDIISLVFWRFIQGAGACASLVLGRAMIRDISADIIAAKRLSLLSTVMSLTPAFAPLVGGFIYSYFGWKAIFTTLLIIIIILKIFALKFLPETLNLAKSSPKLKKAPLAKSLDFVRYVMIASINSTSIYGFLTAAPFILENQYKMGASAIGGTCLLVVLGVSLGSLLSTIFSTKHSSALLIKKGLSLCALGSIFMFSAYSLKILNFELMVLAMMIYSIGAGIVTPNAVSILMRLGKDAAGSASSIYGIFQMATGTAFTFLVSICDNTSAAPLALTLLSVSILNIIVHETTPKKNGV